MLTFLTEVDDIFKTEFLAPVVCYMCHENCKGNGVVIMVCLLYNQLGYRLERNCLSINKCMYTYNSALTPSVCNEHSLLLACSYQSSMQNL